MILYTDTNFVTQWHPKYASQVFPLVIPRMVSGADYDAENRWRRTAEDAPVVTPMQYLRGCVRRFHSHFPLRLLPEFPQPESRALQAKQPIRQPAGLDQRRAFGRNRKDFHLSAASLRLSISWVISVMPPSDT